MEITKTQENTLGNFNEQLRSVKTNVSVANDELEGILKAKDEESAAFENALVTHAEVMAQLRKERIDTEEANRETRDQLAGETRKLEADMASFEMYRVASVGGIESGYEALAEEKRSSEYYLVALREEIKKLTDEMQSLGSSCMKLTTQEAELNESVNFLIAATTTAEDDVKYFTQQKEETVALADKEIKSKQEELMQLESRIAEETEKIQLPKENLDLREIQLEQRAKQIEILYQRTKKAFQRMYPDRDIDNLIK